MLSTRREWNIKSVMICKKIYLTIARLWGRKRDRSKILMPPVRFELATQQVSCARQACSLIQWNSFMHFSVSLITFLSIRLSIDLFGPFILLCLSVYVLACRSISLSNPFCLSVHSCEKISWRNEKLPWQIFTKVNVFWSSYQLNRLCCVASLFEQVCVWVGVGNVL